MTEQTKAYIVDSETGETMNSIKEGDTCRITRAASKEKYTQTQEWKLERFYKGHSAEIRKLMLELSTVEKAFLFTMALYVSYEDCCLKYDNGNELSFDDMQELTGLSRGALSKAITSLIKKDILYRGKNSKSRQYFVNPWVFCKGNRINKVLKTMFQNYRVRVCGGVRWKDL